MFHPARTANLRTPTASTDTLDAVGSRTLWAGDELGLASALKLACNAWVASLTAAAAQSLSLARAAGLDPQLVLDAIKDGASDSPYLQLKGQAMLAENYEVSFALDGVRKDLDLIAAAASATDVRPDLIDALRTVFGAASDDGHGDDDMERGDHRVLTGGTDGYWFIRRPWLRRARSTCRR